MQQLWVCYCCIPILHGGPAWWHEAPVKALPCSLPYGKHQEHKRTETTRAPHGHSHLGGTKRLVMLPAAEGWLMAMLTPEGDTRL